MAREDIAAAVEGLKGAVGHIDPRADPEIYTLLGQLTEAASRGDREAVRAAAREMESHSLGRYAAVTELAGALLRS